MLLAIACLILSQRLSQDLDPREYVSPSGEYVLRVDPSARDGSGPGSYSLRKGGTEVWGREFPFTLRKAVVADDGTSAGYGHKVRGDYAEGDFIVALLSPRGELLLEERTERTPGPQIHSAPDPNALGLFLQHGLRRAILRIDGGDFGEGNEEWWSYALDPPHLKSKVEPQDLVEDSETMRRTFDARGLPGTPLTLAHWYLWDWPEIGARFVLHDADFREVWRLDLPTDYATESDEGDLLDDVREHGAILAIEAGRFELRFYRDAERVTFEVRPDLDAANEWTVVESARADFVAPDPPVSAEIPTLELPLIERVRLGGPEPVDGRVVRDVVAFDVDSEGAVRFIRRKKGEPVFTSVSLAADGTVVSEMALDPLPRDVDANVHWAALSRSDWLVVGCTTRAFEDTGRTLAWRWEGTTGELVELATFSMGPVQALAPLSDGGFAVLANSRGSMLYQTLSVHDPDGRARWSLTTHDVEDQALSAPDDLAASTSNVLALVSSVRKTVELFDLEGEHVRTIELAEVWSQAPGYPVGITPDVDAGIIVFDSRDDPHIWRMSLKGKVRGTLRPRFPDGNAPTTLARKLQIGRDGRLWTTDGSALHRLDEDGVVDRTVGAPPEGDRLERPGAMEIDHLGRVLVQDRRTGSVHVFDARGARLLVCTPDPTDYENVGDSNHLQVSGDGSLHVQRNGDYLDFGPDGARRGVRRFPFAHPVFRPRSEDYWTSAFHGRVRRIDPAGQVAVELTRHPNGNWLQTEALDVNADGSVVVYDWDRRGTPSLLVFDRDGRERRTILLPEAVRGYHVSSTERWAAVWKHKAVAFLIEIESGKVFSFEADRTISEDSTWKLGFSPDGSELWWICQDTLELMRFALPAD